MFVQKYWLQISSILKPHFAVVRNIKKKEKGGVAASRLYKKDSQYKLAKAIFVDALNMILNQVANGHMVEINDKVWFQVDYKRVINRNPYEDRESLIRAENKIPYIYFYFYGMKVKVIPSKSITEKMIDRMGDGYRFTRRVI